MVNEIEFKYIQPGKPTQNALVERFNKSYREGELDVNLFETIDKVRVTQEWVWDFNNHRPHDALKGMSLVAYKKHKESLFGLRSAPASPPQHEDQRAVNLTLN
jgi:putative transposase